MRSGTAWLLPFALALAAIAGGTIWLVQHETPLGALEGVVLAEETGRPLPGAIVELQPLDSPTPEVSGLLQLRSRPDGSFHTNRIPAGAYRVAARSRAHRLRGTRLEIEEGAVRRATLELAPVPPYFTINISQNTVTPQEHPELIAHGFLPGGAVDFQLYQVDPTDLLVKHHGYLRGLLRSQAPPEHLQLEDNPGLTLAGRFSAEITQRDPEGIFHQRIAMPQMTPGIYLVVARAEGLEQLDWVMVTRLGIILKRWGDQALAYVADLKSGEPVPGATVEFSSAAGRAAGVSDQKGLFQARLPVPAGSERRVLARAEKDGSQAFLVTYAYGEGGEPQDRVYAYTDRPVYRPGHVVHFKGIVRRWANYRYSVVADTPVGVEVWDARDTLVHKEQLRTNSFGSFHSALRLNREAATGIYRMVTKLGGNQHESYFKVAEYRKPEYTVTVSPARKRYTRGETIAVEVSAQYYFGAPVAGAEVRYLVRRAPYWFWPREEDEEEYGEEQYGYDYGEVIEEGRARTDGEGVARFQVDTKPALAFQPREDEEEQLGEETQDYRYTIEATVVDASRKEASGEGSTLVTQGEFKLFLSPRRWVAAPGEPAEVEISVRDYRDRPVRGVEVELTAGPHQWEARALRLEPEARGRVTTDEEGKALYRFSPVEEGHYRLLGRATDRLGNRVRAVTYLWVTGSRYADFGGVYPQLEIVADRKLYWIGDTAVVLINSQLKGASALVTVEGPELFWRQLVKLQGSSTRIEVPVRREYAPNFFLAVALVRDKEFVSADKRLRVSVEERRLRVAVKPDKTRYQPGEQATYRLEVSDWRGRPAQAELSVGVVDESIYAIQEELAEPMARFFYPPRYNAVDTSYSFAQIYLDADKEPVAIKVRRRFPDTAYWNPTVVTDQAGRAEISFPMPDTLTTWRATVRAATLETAVGEGVAKVTCSKELLVRLEMPRFLTQKDRTTIAAIAHNYTAGRQALEMWLTAPRLGFPRAPRGGERVRFSLSPEDSRRQDWWVEAGTVGTPEVTAYLKGERNRSDAMALPLPVLPHGRERVEWRSGAVQQTVTERLPVRVDAVPGASELEVRLAPSLAGVMLGALDYLASYPYGCTEQTMSAFLPDVVVARTLRELELPNPDLERKLPDMVQAGLNRLYGYQHDDGGWGWWEYDASDPWMTAYVVFGLLTAKRAGYAVNERFLGSGLEWLLRHASQRPNHLTRDRAYLLYVLALAGRNGLVDRHLGEFYRNLNNLDAHPTALVANALLARGRRQEARVAAARLWRLAEETRATVSWKGAGDWGRGGDVEATAAAFQALAELTPEDPRLARVVRWLVLHREGNRWVSTRDTAFVLYALTGYLKRSGELAPDYQATVKLNGQQVLSRRFRRESLFAPEVAVTVRGKQLRTGDNMLTISREGGGALYYTVVLRQYVGQEDLARLVTGAGISVERSYHRMVTGRDPRTRVIATAPDPRGTTRFRPQESILARLTITTPREYEYVVIEDPLPAGCEVAEQGDLEPWEWDRWWSHMDVRDEKVAVFARRLPAGSSTIEYHLRPQIPGEYHVMPTEVYAMYNPELRGSGSETRVSLR